MVRGAVITWSRLEDGTLTVEVALEDAAARPPLGATVSIIYGYRREAPELEAMP